MTNEVLNILLFSSFFKKVVIFWENCKKLSREPKTFSKAAMVTRYSNYFIIIYNTTVRLRNIRQPTKFGTRKNEENSRVRILG